MIAMYNLDVIISVGYRVKSHRGVQFRIWATKVLKQYLLQGYSINRQIVALQQHVHDRYLIIDDVVWLLGNSIKDMGRGLTTIIRTEIAPEYILCCVK